MLEHGASLAHSFQELGQGGSSQEKRWQWQDLCLAWRSCPPPHSCLPGSHHLCHPHATGGTTDLGAREELGDEGSVD